MVRKLALAVSIAMGTVPLTVLGLGLGGIQTKSALNQNYVGEIELLSVPADELETVTVKLASPEDFAKAGVERLFVLSRLKFKPTYGKNGKPVVLVTSEDPINEPFLDFLVEVNWPNGKLLREYTVLLDPPATTKRKAATMDTARAGSAGGSGAQAPRKGIGGELSGNQYGPVASADTLWEIALAIKPQNVSVHQMMMALLKANPDAFINGNINRLKKGVVLRVPDADEAASISRQEALAAFQAQNQGLSRGVTQAGSTSKADGAEPKGEAPAAEQDQSRLRIAAAPTGADAGAMDSHADVTAELAKVKQELVTAREAAATTKLENEDLQGQVSTLETRVADLQRLLTLKDDQLAQLQASVSAQPAPEPVNEAALTPAEQQPAAAVEPAPMPEPTPVASTVAQGEKAPEEPSAPSVTPPAPTPAAVAEPPEQKVAKPKPPTKPAPQASWLEENMVLLGGGGAVVVGLLAAIWARRKKSASAASPEANDGRTVDVESILMDDVPSKSSTGATAATAEHDTSFLSEYSTEELKALQEDTAEVDPVSEADVYVAYGRYQQALNILQEALTNDNIDHTAVRYKMLEVYFATQSRDQFVALAEELVSSGQVDENSSQWQHVKTMGRDLDKGNPLFREGAASVDAVSELRFDRNKEEEESVGAESEMSLDLSKLAEELDSVIGEDSQPVEGLESLELDLSRFKLDAHSEPTKAEDSGLSELDVLDAGDETELHTQMADISDLADLDDMIDDTDHSLDDELAEVSSELQDIMADSMILDEPLALGELDAVTGIPAALEDEEVGAAVEAKSTSIDLDSSPGFDDFGPESVLGAEAETKLELAQAYIDMGDREGALSILQEVEEDGTEEQREAAARMLSQLNA